MIITCTQELTAPKNFINLMIGHRGTEELKPSDKYIIKKEGKKRILIVKNCTQSDAAEYSCVLGSLKTSCKLNVICMYQTNCGIFMMLYGYILD